MIRVRLAIFLMCCAQMMPSIMKAQAVRPVKLSLVPVFGSKHLVLDTEQYVRGMDTIRINTLRFYISGITLYQDATMVWAEQDSYHLVDAGEPNSMKLDLEPPTNLHFNIIAFNLGIDSATNARGAGGGALDATKGMYWAWQSGYINMKIEGTSPVCNTRKHQFQYHLGGFRGSDYCMQRIVLPVSGRGKISIAVDVAAFLAEADLGHRAEIMIPGPEAVTMSRKAAMMFHIIPDVE